MKRKRNFLKRLAAITAAMAFALGGLLLGSTTAVKVQAAETDEKTDGDWRYKVLEDGTAEITGYDGEATEIEIPGEVGGVRVTSLGENIFDGLDYESVTVPKSVTNIEKYSFGFGGVADGSMITTMPNLRVYGYAGSAAEKYADENRFRFSNLEKEWEYIVGDDGMAYINGYNGKMTEVEIPSSVDGYKVIGTAYWPDFCNAGVFGENDLIESIIIPEGMEYIGSYSFYGCKSLSTIVIPDSVIEIGAGAFSDCSSLENVGIPEGVKYIRGNTFDGCNVLTEVNLPDSLEFIGWRAFSECSSLKSIEIPNSVTSMDSCVFYNCTSLENIKLSEKMTEIPYGLNEGCTSLKNVEIPNGVVKITENAFICEALESVSIPDSVTEIESHAFYSPKMKSIRIPQNVSIIGEEAFGYIAGEYIDGEGWKYVPIPDFTIYGYPNTAAETYAKENGFTFIEIKDEPADASVTVGASGKFSPKLELTKDEALSAVAKTLSAEQLSAVKAGTVPLEIKLSVAKIDGDKLQEADKELIAKAVKDLSDSLELDFNVMNYLDIRLGALLDGEELTVAETDGVVTVSLALDKPANGSYKVIRLHGGKAEAIDSQLSKDGTRLTFKTDKFSTYAIAYSDVASGDNTGASIVIIAICIAGLSGLAAGTATALKKRCAA